MAAKDSLAKDIVTPQAAEEKVVDIQPCPKPCRCWTRPVPPTAFPLRLLTSGPGAGDALVVAASDDCWIEVQDRSGKQVFAQLLRTGDNLRLLALPL